MIIFRENKDITLFQRMKGGEQSAFDYFFRYYYSGLCIYAQQYMKEEIQAEEIVQDVFVGFWEKRNKLNISESVRSYLFRSVRNKCLDHIKHLKVRSEYEDYQKHIGSTYGTDTWNLFVEEELRVLYEAALDKLPPRCREIFLMSRSEGLKNREIAEKMQLSEKTVENQMTKALRILKEELNEYLPLILTIFLK